MNTIEQIHICHTGSVTKNGVKHGFTNKPFNGKYWSRNKTKIKRVPK